jgi:hypothetical protein
MMMPCTSSFFHACLSMLKGGINVDMPAGKGSLSIAQDDRQTFLAGAAASRRSLRL